MDTELLKAQLGFMIGIFITAVHKVRKMPLFTETREIYSLMSTAPFYFLINRKGGCWLTTNKALDEPETST